MAGRARVAAALVCSLAMMCQGHAENACSPDVIRQLQAAEVRALDARSFVAVAGSQRYLTALKHPAGASDPAQYRAIRVVPNGFAGHPALEFNADPCLDPMLCTRTQTQKANFHLLYDGKGAAAGLRFDQRRFFGFLMRIDHAEPKKPAILIQFWQGAPHGPPFALMANPSSNGQLTLSASIMNSTTGSNPSAQRLEIGNLQGIQTGVWYAFIIEAFPHLNDQAMLPHETLNVSFKRADMDTPFKTFASFSKGWGFDPSKNGGCIYAGRCETKPPNPLIDFSFGVYRPVDPTPLRVSYDNIKMATSRSGADPLTYCRSR
jgi:hypothetical protein